MDHAAMQKLAKVAAKQSSKQGASGAIEVEVASPMGMSFDGNASAGFYVTKVKPGSNAEATGKITVGLKFDRVNGTAVANKSKQDIVALIKSGAGPKVSVVFAQDTAGYQAFSAAKDSGSAPAPAQPKASPADAALTNGPTRKPKKSDVGSRCLVTGYDVPGTIRFFGPVGEDGKKKVGVELDAPVGKNNGTVKGVAHFQCADKHGVLTQPSKVQVAGEAAPKKSSTKADASPVSGMYGALEPDASATSVCTFVSPRGKCKREAVAGTPFCQPHSCPGCSNGKGSQEADCGSCGANSAAGPVADGYSDMGRLALIKECRAKGVDYKSAGKDLDALRALLRA